MRRRLLLSGAGALAASAASGALAQQVLVPTNPPAPVAALSITYTQIPTITIPVPAFRALGYLTLGDGGDAMFVKGSSSGPMAVQDLSGQWWELARTGEWSAKAWGAKGDGVTDDTTQLNTWLAGCVTYGQNAFAPPGIYMNTGLFLDCTTTTYSGSSTAIRIRGAHQSRTMFRLIVGSTNDGLLVTTKGGYDNWPEPVISDLTIHGGFYYGRHGIYCYSDPSTDQNYQSVILENVGVLFVGKDGVFAEKTNNYNGRATNVTVAHPGRHAFNLNSSGWRLTGCRSQNAEQAGMTVTNAINNGAGLIRLTVTGHKLTTGQTAIVYFVQGVPNATGVWTVTAIDANTVDLQGSTFAGAFTFQGRCVGVWSISGCADNGAGAIRITTTAAHPYATGDHVFLRDVGGVPNANGGWEVVYVDSTHFDLNPCEILARFGWASVLNGQVYTSGGTVQSFTAGIYMGPYSIGPGGISIAQHSIINSLMGFVITNPSYDPMQYIGGEINDNWMHGITLQTFGHGVNHAFSAGVRMTDNSKIADGNSSDILISNSGSVRFDTAHLALTTRVKYLMESDGTNVAPVFFNPIIDTSGGHNPFSVNVATTTSDTNTPLGYGAVIASGTGNQANRYADAGGHNCNAAGNTSFARGNTTTTAAQYGAGFGQYAHDKSEISLVWGSLLFSFQGDNQTRIAITGGQTTTNATPGRILVGVTSGGSAGAANTFNLFYNYQTAVYPALTVMGKNPATGDTKVWSIANLVAKRGASASAITLNGSGSTIVMSSTYADAALSACTVSLSPDTTNGGINVAVTGIAATTLHWSLDARAVELV